MISSSSRIRRMRRRIEKPDMRATRPEDAEHEHRAGAPEGHHQQPEARQRGAAELRDRERHAAERADRRGPHDQADDAEDDLAGDLEDGDDLLALHLREAGDRRGHEQREHEHAQDLVLHERRDEARRQQVVGDEADDALVAARLADRLLGVGLRGSGDLALEAAARLDDVAREQAEPERDDGHREEVAERAQREPARARHVAERRDADHDGHEDDGTGDGLDQLNERLGQPLGLQRRVLARPARR